jgi:hypothetical protein
VLKTYFLPHAQHYFAQSTTDKMEIKNDEMQKLSTFKNDTIACFRYARKGGGSCGCELVGMTRG